MYLGNYQQQPDGFEETAVYKVHAIREEKASDTINHSVCGLNYCRESEMMEKDLGKVTCRACLKLMREYGWIDNALHHKRPLSITMGADPESPDLFLVISPVESSDVSIFASMEKVEEFITKNWGDKAVLLPAVGIIGVKKVSIYKAKVGYTIEKVEEVA
jgi:hypothetical protein